MENNKITKFTYDPMSIDICNFNIVFDHLHYKLLCKQAQDLSTSVSHLLAMIVERYLVNTQYLDPKVPTSEAKPVSVTLRDIRNNPENLFNFHPNPVLMGDPVLEAPKESTEDEDTGFDFRGLLDE